MKNKVIAFLVLLLVIEAGTSQASSGGEAYSFTSDIIKSLDSFYRGEKHVYKSSQRGKTYTDTGEIMQEVNIYRKGLSDAILLIKPYKNHRVQPIRFSAQKITSSYQQALKLFEHVSEKMLRTPDDVSYQTMMDYSNALNEIPQNITVTVVLQIERNMLKRSEIKALKDQLVKVFGNRIKVEPRGETLLCSVKAAHGLWWALTN